MKRERAPHAYARQGGLRMHVAGNDAQPDARDSLSRCGVILHGPTFAAYLVPTAERCMAGACARAWPPNLRLVVGG